MERLFENLGSVKWPKLPRALPLDPTRGAYSAPYESPVVMANVLTRLILHEKIEVSKSAWIKPWYPQ